jgi:hypothetical protein
MRILTATRVCLALLFVTWTAIGARQGSTNAHEKPEIVSLCELTKHWKKYDHKTVRIEAIYAAQFEQSEVYDPACAASSAWVPPVPYGSPGPPPSGLQARLNDLLKQDRRARIMVIGEFDGPKKVDIPPGTSPGLAATLQAADSHYGHQNRWDFQFVFSRIEKVEPSPPNTPWPRRADQKK